MRVCQVEPRECRGATRSLRSAELLDKTGGFWKNKTILWPLCASGLTSGRLGERENRGDLAGSHTFSSSNLGRGELAARTGTDKLSHEWKGIV